MPVRTAEAEWRGTLKEGAGTVSTESGALAAQPYTFRARFEDGQGGTNPEELIGAANAGCFTMFFSNLAAQAGHPVTRAHTTARVHIGAGEGGPEISRIELALEAEVPGLSEEDFRRLADEAKARCPVSKVLRAAEITLDAQLIAA